MNSQNISHDMFLLMLNLSRMNDCCNICRTFVQAVDHLWQDYHIHWLADNEPRREKDLEIIALNNSFGIIRVESKNKHFEEENYHLLQNSIAMLIIVLENCLREKLLANDNFRLDTEVKKRTKELQESNDTLRKEIYQRSMAESALRKSENNLKKAQRIAHMGNFECNLLSGEVYYSKEFYQIFGYSKAEKLPSKILESHLHPEDKTRVMKILENPGQKESITTHFRIIRNDEEIRIIQATHHTEFNTENIPIIMHGILQDVTEQKQLEDQLHNSQKMDAIGQLAGGIAHDFNNHLAGILGYAEILLDELDNEEHKNYVETIIETAQHSSELTKQLLVFARKNKTRSISINIHKIIAEVVVMLEHTINKNIYIRQLLKSKNNKIIGDPDMIKTALLNLAINAQDAMSNGGEIIFSTEDIHLDKNSSGQFSEISQGNYLQISIIDTGKGIAKEIQKQIFDPFFTTKKTKNSVGMGLAAVYGIVKKHHGAINVCSQPGHGTNFKILLPIEEKKERQQLEEHKANILLIEDEKIVRTMCSNSLKRLGYQVITCQNGKEGLEYYQKFSKSIHLVILDIIMPILGGKETFFSLRKINPNISVILASGYGIDEELQDLIQNSNTYYISKPFRIKHLSEIVEKSLSNYFSSQK